MGKQRHGNIVGIDVNVKYLSKGRKWLTDMWDYSIIAGCAILERNASPCVVQHTEPRRNTLML